MRKLMSVVATAAMLGLGLTSVAPAPVHADGADRYGKTCNPKKYREHYKVSNRTVKPEATYTRSYQLAPGEQWKTSKQIDLQRQVTVKAKASFSYKGGGSVSLPGKLLGELKAARGAGPLSRRRAQDKRASIAVLFDGEATAVRIEPIGTMPGLRAAVLSPRMRPRRWVTGRAAQLGTTGAFVVRDGDLSTRTVRRSTFYRHTEGWLAVK